MCGKRLNDWKTIPIRAPQRVDVDVAGGDLDAADPDPAGLDRLEQVDAAQERRLARARRADQADDLVLGDVEVDPAQHLELAEGLVQALDARARGAGFSRSGSAHTSLPAWCCFRSRAISQSVKRASGIVISDEQRRRDEVRRAVERRRLVDLRLLERLDDAEGADERRVLLQADEVVEERRDHAAHGLREDDEAQRLAVREAERARGRLLARVHRVDARAVHLGDVGRVDEHERDDGPEELRRRQPREAERRHPEAEDRDHEDRRDAAEEIGVDDRERAEREEHRPGQRAEHGDEQRGRAG